MQRRALVLVAIMLVLAGCTAKGEDPFAYAKKPLYTGGYDLARLGNGTQTQEFRVQDGSIASVKVNVWVNATAGGARVDVIDPAGTTVLSTTETTERTFPLNLGAWHVRVTGEEGSAGRVAILAVRG